MNTFKKIILPNGLRVVLAPQKGSLAASVLILVAAGSEYETKRLGGVSHFLEHMVFKQTKNRPRVGQISEELDALGVQSNAFTGQEYTGYWAKASSAKLPKIFDIVSDIYLNPIFNADEIDRERGVIIEELNMEEDNLAHKASELFEKLLYGDQPAGRPIGGDKETLRKILKNDIEAYRRERYVMGGTVVIVAGTFNDKKVLGQTRAAFGKLPRGRASAKPKTTERQTRPATAAHFRESGQSHMVFGFRAFDMFDKRRYALQVLANVLGGGMSSRLFKRVREQLGAAYYIYASADLSLDHGTLEVAAGVDHAKLDTVLGAILEEFRRVLREPIPAAELQRSKDHMTGNLILSLETSDELAGFYATQEILTKTLVSPGGLIKRIQKVTVEDIRAVARAVIRNDGLNMAVVGPYKDAKRFEKILKL